MNADPSDAFELTEPDSPELCQFLDAGISEYNRTAERHLIPVTPSVVRSRQYEKD